jgi:hypothetical protein
MMYEIQLKPRSEDEDGATMFITEEQVNSVKELQSRGSFGTWIGKEYLAFSAIRRISPSTYKPPEPMEISHLLALPDENQESQKTRIHNKLAEIRANWKLKKLSTCQKVSIRYILPL